MKRSTSAVLLVGGVCALCLISLLWWTVAGRLLLGEVWLVVSGHPTKPPSIVEGQILSKDWLHSDEASNRVSRLLQRRFPIGSPASALRNALESKGFNRFPYDVPRWSALD